MDEHLDAIEDVAMRVMGVEGFVARDLGVGVVAFHHIIVDDDGEGAAHDLVIHDDDHLTFREDSNEFLDLCTSPEDIGVGIDTLEWLSQLVVILHMEVTQTHLFDFTSWFHNTYLFIKNEIRGQNYYISIEGQKKKSKIKR